MELSDILGLLDVAVTLIVGFWLSRYFTLQDSRSRVLKDYYIEEAKGLQNDIRTFFARLLSGHVPGSELSRWHKARKNRYKSFDKSIRDSFPVDCVPVCDELFKLHQEITSWDEFNNGFTNGRFNFTSQQRTRISELECAALTLINDYVVQVNKSPGNNLPIQLLNELKHEFTFYIVKTKGYSSYAIRWVWRIVKVIIFLVIILVLYSYGHSWYNMYIEEKAKEKALKQQNINKALDCIKIQNQKLDSIDYELHRIKENMRIRKGINNYWIHTNCSDSQ